MFFKKESFSLSWFYEVNEKYWANNLRFKALTCSLFFCVDSPNRLHENVLTKKTLNKKSVDLSWDLLDFSKCDSLRHERKRYLFQNIKNFNKLN